MFNEQISDMIQGFVSEKEQRIEKLEVENKKQKKLLEEKEKLLKFYHNESLRVKNYKEFPNNLKKKSKWFSIREQLLQKREKTVKFFS